VRKKHDIQIMEGNILSWLLVKINYVEIIDIYMCIYNIYIPNVVGMWKWDELLERSTEVKNYKSSSIQEVADEYWFDSSRSLLIS